MLGGITSLSGRCHSASMVWQPFAIDTLLGDFRRRQRRILGEFLFASNFAFDARIDFGFFLCVPELVLGEVAS